MVLDLSSNRGMVAWGCSGTLPSEQSSTQHAPEDSHHRPTNARTQRKPSRPKAGWVGVARKPSSVPGRGHPCPSDDHSSRPAVTNRLERYTRERGRAAPMMSTNRPCTRVGFAWPTRSPGPPVRSYRTLSTLPKPVSRLPATHPKVRCTDAYVAVCSLLHLPPGLPDRALPGTLP